MFKQFYSDLKKTRWGKTIPTLKTFGITLVVLIFITTFVFLVSWGITAALGAMKGY